MNGGGDAIPHGEAARFYVFFPTEEDHGARALIHVSFELNTSRKHLREGQHDKDILAEFHALFGRVVSEIPPRTALEAFGEVDSGDGESPLNNLQKAIRDTLNSTSFVPVIGGAFVKPTEAQLWNDRLGNALRDDVEQVRDARLLVPDLHDLKVVLQGLGAGTVEEKDYSRLLRYCRNDSPQACFASWRALVTGGLRRVRSGRDSGGDLESLRTVPCWWTENDKARALSDDPPMLFARPEDWPDWLPADTLHSRMRAAVKRWRTRAQERKKTGMSWDFDTWDELISGQLSRNSTQFLHDVLFPFLKDWDNGRWEVDGWKLLGYVSRWSRDRKFDDVEPWVQGAESSREEEKRRAQAAKMLRLPTEEKG